MSASPGKAWPAGQFGALATVRAIWSESRYVLVLWDEVRKDQVPDLPCLKLQVVDMGRWEFGVCFVNALSDWIRTNLHVAHSLPLYVYYY